MRKMQAYRWAKCPTPENPYAYDKVPDFIGLFHGWGVGSEEITDVGVANFSVAILEKEDGSVETVDANFVKFLDPPEGGPDERDA